MVCKLYQTPKWSILSILIFLNLFVYSNLSLAYFNGHSGVFIPGPFNCGGYYPRLSHLDYVQQCGWEDEVDVQLSKTIYWDYFYDFSLHDEIAIPIPTPLSLNSTTQGGVATLRTYHWRTKRTTVFNSGVEEVDIFVHGVIKEVSCRDNFVQNENAIACERIINIPKEQPCYTNNPCNVITGNKKQTVTDYDDGIFEFKRNYLSNNFYNKTNIGIGWTHSLSSRVIFDETGSSVIGLFDGNGFYIPLKLSQGNTYYVPEDASITKFKLSLQGNEYKMQHDLGADYFDQASGLLIKRKLHGKPLVYLNYDATNSRIDYLEDASGRVLDFIYNSVGNIGQIIRPDNLIINYYYDNNLLDEVRYPENGQMIPEIYHYNDSDYPWLLTGITNKSGNTSTYEYDEEKTTTTIPYGGVSPKYFEYYDGKTEVRDSKNNLTEYFFDTENLKIDSIVEICNQTNNDCETSSFTNHYWDGGYLLAEDKNGLVTEYGDYDDLGRYGYIIENSKLPDETSYPVGARRTDFEYHNEFIDKVTKKIEHSVANSNANTHNPSILLEKCDVTGGDKCKITTSSYDSNGNLLSKIIQAYKTDGTFIDATGTSGYSRKVTWLYNGPYNQLSQIDGPREDVSDVTTLEYYSDTDSDINRRGRLWKVTLANGTVSRQINSYSPTGKILSESRPNGVNLSYTYYPGNERLDTLTHQDATDTIETKFTYENTGEVKTITQAYGTADASTTTFHYYPSRLLWKIEDDLDNYIEYGYDTEGNQTSEDVYDASGTLKRSLSKTYDRFNRLDLTQRNYNSDDSDYAADGTLDKFFDGRGIETDYSYDNLRRLTQTIQDAGNLDITTTYVYDVADRLVKVTDPESQDTTYEYDDLGNLRKQTSPDTGITTYDYDAAGNMMSKTDANGITIGYIYDELNRLTNINYPNNTDVIYDYDDTVNSTNGIGRLTSVSDASGTVVYDYDQNGNITSQTRTQDTLTFTTSYDYNIRDELTKITYPSGREVNYIKNRLGQATEITTTFGGSTETVANNISYLPFGPQNSLTFGNGAIQTKTFDSDYRLTGIADQGILLSDNADQGSVMSEMTLDANGNIDDQTRTFSYSFCDGNICGDLTELNFNDFQYDNLNRIIQDFSPTSSYTEGFTYDDVGNRKTRTYNGSLKNYFYGANDHHLEQIANGTVSSFTYDNVGNTKTANDYTFFYDDINRLSSIEDLGQTQIASYVYDSSNLRTKKISTDTYYYQYDLEGQLIAEFDQSGNAIREYIYLNSMPIALVSSPNTVTQALFQDDCTGTDGTVIDDQADGFWKGKNPTSDISATIQNNQAEVNPNEWIQTNTIFKDEAGSTLNVSYSMESTGKSNLRKLGTSKRGIQVHFKPNDDQAIVKLGTTNNSADKTTINFVNSGVQSINVDISISEGVATVNITDSLGQLYTVGPVDHSELSTGDEYKLRLQTLKISGSHVPSTVDGIDITAQSIATVEPSSLYFYHVDQLGTPKLMTRSDQSVAWSANHSAFGDANISVEDVTNHIRFPGQYYDQETGLHYNWNRYYDPSIGRYITSDPIGLNGGINTYGYAIQNPTNLTDRYGLLPQGDFSFAAPSFGSPEQLFSDLMDSMTNDQFSKLPEYLNSQADAVVGCIGCVAKCTIGPLVSGMVIDATLQNSLEKEAMKRAIDHAGRQAVGTFASRAALASGVGNAAVVATCTIICSDSCLSCR